MIAQIADQKLINVNKNEIKKTKEIMINEEKIDKEMLKVDIIKQKIVTLYVRMFNLNEFKHL